MAKFTSKKLLLTILVLGLFLPFYNTQANSFFGLGSVTYGVVSSFFGYSLYLTFWAIGEFMGIAVKLLGWVVNLRVYTNVPVVAEGWKIMRDFANMLFIIALVVMAYGTIFNVRGYDFRSLIPKFLIAALLINFSLVLGGLVIDGTQILNNTFLLAMGDISGRLGNGLNPSELLPDSAKLDGKAQAEGIANLVSSSFITLLFAIFLAMTFLVSVAVPLVVAFVRIPILWALLIVSPMAWLLNILPATQQVYKNWWRQFLAWNLFLPYYLFFMYFALYFLSKKDEVIRGLGQDFVYNQLSGLQSNFTFGLLFYYVMIAVFLIGGTKVAMNAGKFSGTGIVSVAKWGRGVAMRRLGVTAAQRAAQEKLAQVKEEGLPGRFGALYGGEAGLERQTDVFRKMLGVRGGFKGQKEFVSTMDKELANLKDMETAGRLKIDDEFKKKASATSSDTAKGAAMRAVLYERGMIDPAEFGKDLRGWVGKNPFLAEKMVDLAQKGGFKNVSASQLLDMASGTVDASRGVDYGFLNTAAGVGVRKKMFNALVGDKDIPGLDLALSKMDANNLRQAVDIFGGDKTNEAAKYKKALARKRADIVAAHNATVEGTSTNYEMWKLVREKGAKDLAEMLPPTWRDSNFQGALKTKMRLLEKYNPRIPSRGTYFQRGATLPPGYGPGTATPGTPLGGGLFFDIVNLPGGRFYNKGTRTGGGETFRSSLLRQTIDNPRKNRIAATL